MNGNLEVTGLSSVVSKHKSHEKSSEVTNFQRNHELVKYTSVTSSMAGLDCNTDTTDLVMQLGSDWFDSTSDGESGRRETNRRESWSGPNLITGYLGITDVSYKSRLNGLAFGWGLIINFGAVGRGLITSTSAYPRVEISVWFPDNIWEISICLRHFWIYGSCPP